MTTPTDAAPDPYLDRKGAATEITKTLFPVSPRKLLDWTDVEAVILNGRRCARRSQWLAAAKRRLDSQIAAQNAGQDLPARRAIDAALAAKGRRRRLSADIRPPESQP